ncbi:hypothetical protein A0256_12570 [Mucilaginibacter sp. PAMC 26640]|nr:hypothetical protein A0256_12570 [Mucilaginibacter sp. PAMC 26640]
MFRQLSQVSLVVAIISVTGLGFGRLSKDFFYFYNMLNQQQIFPSKKGILIYIPLIILLAVAGPYLWKGSYVGAMICLGMMLVLYFPILFNTYYTVNDNGLLQVKCGLFIDTKIEIANIKKIVDTRTVISSPALSLDRLEIFYNKFDTIIVSPKHKADFIAALKKINPAISYSY